MNAPRPAGSAALPSTLGGIAIIAGSAVGAGMFSLPVVSAGMGFGWSVFWLAVTWFFMLQAALLITETTLDFPTGASFDTVIGATLGPGWNRLGNLAFLFVLYTLCYAFVSGGSSILAQTLRSGAGISVSPVAASLAFAAAHAGVVWLGSSAVGRISVLIVVGMIASFGFSIARLTVGIEPARLLDAGPGYALFAFAALPMYLTAFGFHGSVPSLVKHYRKDVGRVRRALFHGSLLALLTYVVWQAVTLGQIPREGFRAVIAAGGNIGPIVAAISGHGPEGALRLLLDVFATLAVISSFLGGALGLFDYLADRCGFADDGGGRLKTALLTFAPPGIASALFPDGFITAIGFAGLVGTAWAIFLPVMSARANRRRSATPLYRVPGGNLMLAALVAFGVLIISCHLLALAGVLPVFGR